MSERTKLIAGVVALALLFAATALLVHYNETKGLGLTKTSGISYVNHEYGYAFTYDDTHTLVELSSAYQHIERAGEEPNEVVAIALEKADADTTYTNFEDFAHSRATIFCAADGPHGSMSCSGVSRAQPFTTATGIGGEIFYLDLSMTTQEGTSTREAGPFYVFDVSDSVPDVPYAALYVHPARFYEESTMYDEGAKVANDIVNSLQILPSP